MIVTVIVRSRQLLSGLRQGQSSCWREQAITLIILPLHGNLCTGDFSAIKPKSVAEDVSGVSSLRRNLKNHTLIVAAAKLSRTVNVAVSVEHQTARRIIAIAGLECEIVQGGVCGNTAE